MKTTEDVRKYAVEQAISEGEGHGGEEQESRSLCQGLKSRDSRRREGEQGLLRSKRPQAEAAAAAESIRA